MLADYSQLHMEIAKAISGKPSSRDKDGGKAIGSGGFGCVFRPALRCEGKKSQQPPKGTISKLMSKEDAEEEIQEVKRAYQVVKTIPNFEKYFAVTDYGLCQPAKLRPTDKVHFDTVCEPSLGFTSRQFDKSRKNHELLSIWSPDLGTDLSNVIEKMFDRAVPTPQSQKSLHNGLAKLLRHLAQLLDKGISKLSEHNFYHSYVKPEN